MTYIALFGALGEENIARRSGFLPCFGHDDCMRLAEPNKEYDG